MQKGSLPETVQCDPGIDKGLLDPAKSPQGTFVAAAWRVCFLVAIMSSVWGIGILVNQPTCTGDDFMSAKADIHTLQTNLIRYRTMTGSWPSEAQGLRALAEKPVTDPVPTSWHKLMDLSRLIDTWGHPYQYRNPGKGKTSGLEVYSMGPDGQDGTEDDVYAQQRE